LLAERAGVEEVVASVVTDENKRNLQAKAEKPGHVLAQNISSKVHHVEPPQRRRAAQPPRSLRCCERPVSR
jgi:hypothetical protein